jgi:steroid 5-alpha reductase family enzyme
MNPGPLALLAFDFAYVLFLAALFFSATWVVARLMDNWSIVDVAWAYGFALIGFWILAVSAWNPMDPFLWLATATTLWSLRLGTHLAIRVLGHLDREDGRYLKMRAEWGPATGWKMYRFYLYQAVALALLLLPLISAAPAGAPRPWHWAGLALFLVAMIGEALADAQLAAFKRDPANRGQVCRRGLWAWTRHPNYFCEWLTWLAFALLSCNATYFGLPGFACAAVMYHLLTKVTGIPLTEAQLLASKGQAYADYQRDVPAFWPRPPRR